MINFILGVLIGASLVSIFKISEPIKKFWVWIWSLIKKLFKKK